MMLPASGWHAPVVTSQSFAGSCEQAAWAWHWRETWLITPSNRIRALDRRELSHEYASYT